MDLAKSGRECRQHRLVSREFAAEMLWAAFPSNSENELCEKAARVIDTSPNTIRRILRKETDAKLSIVFPIIAMGLASRGIDLWEALGKEG